MNLFIRWLISGLAIFTIAYVLPGVQVDDLASALIVAVVLGILNTFIKPILVILTLPITILTLGLFSLFINAFLILFVERLVPRFAVSGLFSALVFGLVLSIINSVVHAIVK